MFWWRAGAAEIYTRATGVVNGVALLVYDSSTWAQRRSAPLRKSIVGLIPAAHELFLSTASAYRCVYPAWLALSEGGEVDKRNQGGSR